MIFLYSTISSSKSIFVMVVSHRQASAPIAPPGRLHRFLEASGLADCSFLLYCVSPRNWPRTSPCLGGSPLVCLACCGLCSCLLLAVLFCLLLAVLFSVLLILSPLLDGERFDVLPRYPRARVAPLSSFHHLVVCCGSVSDSHHLLLGSGSVSDSSQRHFVVDYIFLDASPAPPTPLLSSAPFVIVGSR